MPYRTIKTVFDSKCSSCGCKLPEGTPAVYDPEKKKIYCLAHSPEISAGFNGEMVVRKEADIPSKLEVTVKTDIKAAIDELSGIATKTREDAIKKLIKDSDTEGKKIRDKIYKNVKSEIEKEFGHIPKVVIEIVKEGKKKTIKEITHVKFPDIIKLISSDVPVFLMGNAGTGKNHICKQVAETLDLQFYFTNAVSNEYKITGFIDANGKYHETQFYEAFTKGGLFFFDEIDASVPEVLVLLNAAIENRYFNFPTGKVDAHPDFRVIAAGNTYGTGADIMFSGRYQLDAASLDRFALIEIDYDRQVENLLSGGDTELVEFIHIIRDVVRQNSIRVVVSYRAINQIAKMVHGQGINIKDAIQYGLIKGMSIDDMTIIKKHLPNTSNKYLTAYKEIITGRENK